MCIVILLAGSLGYASNRHRISLAVLFTAWNLACLLRLWLHFLGHGPRY